MSEASGLEKPTGKIPFLVENIDPSDILPKLFSPNLIEQHVTRYNFVHDYVKTNLPELLNRDISILDAASGRGYGSGILKKNFPKATVVGLEYKREYLEKAANKYNGENLSFLQADARVFPLKDNSVDIVATFETIEHLPKKDQPSFVKEIARALKPGGVAFVSFPHRHSFETNRKNETVRVSVGSNPYHLYEPLPNEIDQYLGNSGLEIIGKFGQVLVPEKTANIVNKINKIVPIWSIFEWKSKKEVGIVPVPKGKIGATYLYVARKPLG